MFNSIWEWKTESRVNSPECFLAWDLYAPNLWSGDIPVLCWSALHIVPCPVLPELGVYRPFYQDWHSLPLIPVVIKFWALYLLTDQFHKFAIKFDFIQFHSEWTEVFIYARRRQIIQCRVTAMHPTTEVENKSRRLFKSGRWGYKTKRDIIEFWQV